MQALVVYDTLYGNTEKIARAVGQALELRGQVTICRVGELAPDQLEASDLLVVGPPTQRFYPTPALGNFLQSLPPNALSGKKVAAFDTRLTWEVIQKSPPLPFFERLFGYAAARIAKALKKKGGTLVVEPEGFFVEGMEGPLSAGELERAEAWAEKLCA